MLAPNCNGRVVCRAKGRLRCWELRGRTERVRGAAERESRLATGYRPPLPPRAGPGIGSTLTEPRRAAGSGIRRGRARGRGNERGRKRAAWKDLLPWRQCGNITRSGTDWWCSGGGSGLSFPTSTASEFSHPWESSKSSGQLAGQGRGDRTWKQLVVGSFLERPPL